MKKHSAPLYSEAQYFCVVKRFFAPASVEWVLRRPNSTFWKEPWKELLAARFPIEY